MYSRFIFGKTMGAVKRLALPPFSSLLLLIVTAGLENNAFAQGDQSKRQPNILWIVLEDTAPLLSCYGTSIISTPNIDKLAVNGVFSEVLLFNF